MTPGTQIGPYEILSLLGAGGMGEVYRAKDSTLKREVALKVLPADVAKDRERLARFQREAEVLASLNHPHIAQIYGLEHTDDTFALVMELVEGEDLAQRIRRGAIPIDEALQASGDTTGRNFSRTAAISSLPWRFPGRRTPGSDRSTARPRDSLTGGRRGNGKKISRTRAQSDTLDIYQSRGKRAQEQKSAEDRRRPWSRLQK